MNEAPRLDRLTRAYDRMMERVKSRLDDLGQAERHALPYLQQSIEHAAEAAIALGELTREEASLIGTYIKRDLEDAGHYLAVTGKDLNEWLRFDLGLVEERLLEWFSRAADQNRLEMLDFQETVERASHYATGEITGPGSLQCEACGKVLQFHATAHIPACPQSHRRRFQRLIDTQS
ncbi:MAG: zinc ribbon-containing protein [Gammaproteobacteria bacterium]